MNVIDTNIWLYSHDRRDPAKQATAQRLIDTTKPLLLPWQVGCEFIAGSRKLALLGMDVDKAWLAFESMCSMSERVLLPTVPLWSKARDLQQRHSLSFWDALLVAGCIEERVQLLYSEDMGAPRDIDGLTLINPFV